MHTSAALGRRLCRCSSSVASAIGSSPSSTRPGGPSKPYPRRREEQKPGLPNWTTRQKRHRHAAHALRNTYPEDPAEKIQRAIFEEGEQPKHRSLLSKRTERLPTPIVPLDKLLGIRSVDGTEGVQPSPQNGEEAKRSRIWSLQRERRDTESAPASADHVAMAGVLRGIKGVPSQRAPSANWKTRLLMPNSPTIEILMETSVEDIKTALSFMQLSQDDIDFSAQGIDRHARILLYVQHLLRDRDQTPCIFLYECLADAMIDPQGSATGLRKILRDMESSCLKPSANLCQSALAVLANHPDYVLRLDIEALMRQYWFPLGVRAKQKLLLGLLRDGQYELAWLRLTQALAESGERSEIKSWVYDIFIAIFGKLGFLDEMLQLLHRRRQREPSDQVQTSLIHYALDVCSQSFHHEGTLFTWTVAVRSKLLQPANGIVENVLATAARHGDASLATEALNLISQRTRLLAHHYEAVVEAFSVAGDLPSAMKVFRIMKQNGIDVQRSSTRVLHRTLMGSPSLLQEAQAALEEGKETGDGSLPLAMVCTIVEVIAELRSSEEAMDLFQATEKLCGEAPDVITRQALVAHGRSAQTTRAMAKHYEEAVHEAKDPVRAPKAYNALISACAEAGALDLAFRFATQAARLSMTTEELGWVKALVNCAGAAEDGRIWGIMDELERRIDGETRSILQKWLRQARMAKRALALKPRNTA